MESKAEIKELIPIIGNQETAKQYINIIVSKYSDKIPRRAFLPIVPVFWDFGILYHLIHIDAPIHVISSLVDYFPELFDGPFSDHTLGYLVKHEQFKKLDKIITCQYEIDDDFISLILDIKRQNPRINIYGSLDFCTGLQNPRCTAHTLKLRQTCLENNIKFYIYPKFYCFLLYHDHFDFVGMLQTLDGLFEQIDWRQVWKECLENLDSFRPNMHLSLYPILTRPEFIDYLSQTYQDKFNLGLVPPENFNLLPDQDKAKILHILLFSNPKWINQHNLFESNRHLISNNTVIRYNPETKQWFEKHPELFNICHVEIITEDFAKLNQCDIMYCIKRLNKFNLCIYKEEICLEICNSLSFDDQIIFVTKFMQYSPKLREIYLNRNIELYLQHKEFLNYCDEMEQS